MQSFNPPPKKKKISCKKCFTIIAVILEWIIFYRIKLILSDQIWIQETKGMPIYITVCYGCASGNLLLSVSQLHILAVDN